MSAKRTSKYLSLLLRHAPEKANLQLDAGGWVALDTLLANTPPWVTRASVLAAVAENDKQRFTIEDGRIRANQGHSVPVDLGLEPVEPPELLFHGTFHGAVPAIEREGLKPMNRQHVHLAAETGTAVTVGRRQGTPIVFTVLAKQMHAAGHSFYRSVNGVWLCEHVPSEFLRRDR